MLEDHFIGYNSQERFAPAESWKKHDAVGFQEVTREASEE
jgi:hypothetical protein